MTPDIVASIVTYRSPVDEVKAAAESFFAECPLGHLIVVDNDSGEGYRTALRAVVPERTQLILAPRNGGFGYGHNLALLNAPRFDFYLVMNPDLVLHPGSIGAMTAFFAQKPQAGLVAPRVLYEDGRLQPLNKRNPNLFDLLQRRLVPARWQQRFAFLQRRAERYQMLDVGYDAPCAVPFVSGCCLLVRGDVMIRLGGFDQRFFLYFEDADFSRRVWEIAEAWYCPGAVVTHRWHRGSKSSMRLFVYLIESMVVYFTKWGWEWW